MKIRTLNHEHQNQVYKDFRKKKSASLVLVSLDKRLNKEPQTEPMGTTGISIQSLWDNLKQRSLRIKSREPCHHFVIISCGRRPFGRLLIIFQKATEPGCTQVFHDLPEREDDLMEVTNTVSS